MISNLQKETVEKLSFISNLYYFSIVLDWQLE